MGATIKITISLLAVLLCPWAPAMAMPTVLNQAVVANDAKSVIINFIQPDIPSMANCHYSVLAARSALGLKNLPGNGISIASFKRNEPLVQIIAAPLRRLKRQSAGALSKPWVYVYVRTEIPCPGYEWGKGETIRFRIPTFKHGQLKTVKQLILDMKYHMQYYQPGE